MNEEMATKAAKWWADQLREPAKLDNGDNSDTGMMTMMMATLLQADERKEQDTTLIDAFEAELKHRILDAMSPYQTTIGVDYGPDLILVQAAEAVGLELGMTTLPWKTTMWFRDDQVYVACGYGAEAIML